MERAAAQHHPGATRKRPARRSPARAIGILNTAIYDAWAPYDQKAVGTRLLGAYRLPAAEDTLANKNEAISYAAYRVLTDLFPATFATSVAAYNQQMSDLGYDPIDTSTRTPPPRRASAT